MVNFITNMVNKIVNGYRISYDEAKILTRCKGSEILELLSGANRIRERYFGNRVDLCSVVNAKSGNCQEDCRFCAQSSKHMTFVNEYELMPKDEMLKVALDAWEKGARRFCISTSGKKVNLDELNIISSTIKEIKNSTSLYCCATLGDLNFEELSMLKEAGLDRFHHNIETSVNHFKSICTTHSYEDRINTITMAKKAGLSTCVGGIIGMGETQEDWLRMAIHIRELEADSVPINFLMPIPGTPMEKSEPLPPMEALKAIALFRYIIPDKELRVCGGRISALQELHSFILFSGADGMMIGNYLTMVGRDPSKDLKLIKELGMDPREVVI